MRLELFITRLIRWKSLKTQQLNLNIPNKFKELKQFLVFAVYSTSFFPSRSRNKNAKKPTVRWWFSCELEKGVKQWSKNFLQRLSRGVWEWKGKQKHPFQNRNTNNSVILQREKILSTFDFTLSLWFFVLVKWCASFFVRCSHSTEMAGNVFVERIFAVSAYVCQA